MRAWPLLLVPFTVACAGACGPRAAHIDLAHDGLDRHYLLYSPSSWDGVEQLPVVVALHGGGGTARGLQRFTGFNELAEADGFHVAYPNGVDNAWNDGRTEVRGRDLSIDDLGFIDAVVDDVTDRTGEGPRLLTGVSNGAFMTWAVVCGGSTDFDAIAPVIGGLSTTAAPHCEPAGPVATLIIQGTDDPLVPYAGGAVTVLGKERGQVVGTPQTVEMALRNNGCAEHVEPAVDTIDDDQEDGTSVVWSRWTQGCAAPVEELRIVGGGHTWPDGSQYLPESLIGTVSHEVSGEQVIWEFLLRQPGR